MINSRIEAGGGGGGGGGGVGGITLKCRTLKLSYTIYLCKVTRPQHS